MKINLFRDHTALLTDDQKTTITTEPASAGTLEIEGRRFEVAESGTVFYPQLDLVGHARVTFTTKNGSRYVGIRPYMSDVGMPVSRPDYAAEYAKMRIHMDELERQVDKLAEAYHKLSSETHKDALGFLTHNSKKTEVK